MKTPRILIVIAILHGSGGAFATPVALSSTWEFHDPEGNSFLTNQSASGFDSHHSNYAGSSVDPNTEVEVTSVTPPPLRSKGGIKALPPKVNS
ncbi:MAG: hypothetical protein QNL33_05485 [Akkermansiaceae bacterium]|jgi:hypothetical protein